MCIEASERFGLSGLHQFRGRVGRGEHQSYCYLFTTKEYKSERLRAMEKTNDGFELSEIDLELR
jgi:ATP-dependent DNA helicase RecG